jgi:hypothetical protein
VARIDELTRARGRGRAGDTRPEVNKDRPTRPNSSIKEKNNVWSAQVILYYIERGHMNK